MTREHLAEMVQRGLVTPTGLISHGRGEAYDYLMGEESTAFAKKSVPFSKYRADTAPPIECANK